jgi:hypothetical protein
MAQNDDRARRSAAHDEGHDRAREQARLMTELQQTHQQVVRLLQSMVPAQDWQPEPAEWSFRYLAAHLATVEEECHLQRVRQIAAGDTPTIPNYRDRGVDFSREELADSLAKWQSARNTLIEFVGELSTHELAYIGIHEKLGVMTLLDALQEIVEQDQGHLRHIRRLILAYEEEARHTPPSSHGTTHGTVTGQTENGSAPLYTNHKHGAM